MNTRSLNAPAAGQGRRRWKPAVAGSTLLLVVVLPLMAVSCRKSTTTDGKARDAKRDCATLLEAAIEMAQPEKLGSETNFSRTTDRFNDWYRDCPDVHEFPAKIGPEGKRLAAELFSKEELKQFEEDSFDEQDVRHVRNSLLFARIVRAAITDSAATDLEQTVELFRYIVRNIELVALKPDETPRTPFHVLLLGKGTAEDRAWIFASLLRQLKIPAIVLTSGKKEPADNSAFVVGVPLNGQIYLFDTRLGLPIPTPDDKLTEPFISKPATLKQFVENPKVAAGLSVSDFRYPLTGEDLKEPRVWLIGHRSLFSPRMKRLQFLKGVKWRKSVMFDWLDDDEKTGPGLYSRMVKAGANHWKPEAIRIWPYLTKVFTSYANRNDSQRSESRDLMRPFKAPLRVTLDKETQKKKLEGPTDLQFRTRILQWEGDYRQAVQNFMNVRLQCGLPPQELQQFPELNQRMMLEANDDATYWIGVCQYEQGEYRDSVNTLASYIRTSRSKKWVPQARYILAMAWMSQNKPATALTLLDQLSKDNPQAHGNRLLWKRWDAIREVERKKATKK